MIFTKRIITIKNNKSSINEPVVVYRCDGDVNVEFAIMNNPFSFADGTDDNASYGQLVILGLNDICIFSEVSECVNGEVIFTIRKDMIDEMSEVGNYTFQIRLYNHDQSSRISIPPVYNGIEVREALISEDEAIE